MQPKQATAPRAETRAGTQPETRAGIQPVAQAETAAGTQRESPTGSRWSEPTCVLRDDADRLVARVDEPADGGPGEPIDLGATAKFEALRAEHRRRFAEGLASDSMPTLIAATEDLLAEVYDTVAAPLLHRLESFPRVALSLKAPWIRLLPIETAHRSGEPALFEVTQLYRTQEDGRRQAWHRPRRFRLNLLPSALGTVDLIALEQCLIHSVSITAGGPHDGGRREPLIHVAGHDPTIPAGLVEPDDLAHVVLSGCNSLPTVLPDGVASAVGSLWPVDEYSNSSMMAAYHSRLAIGISPIEALRQAQMLHRRLPPIAWAAYVHVGQPI